MNKKCVKLACRDGEEASEMRRELGKNQSDFWNPIGVTQSGGSRYEAGRKIPISTRILVKLVYGSEKQSLALLGALRAAVKNGSK